MLSFRLKEKGNKTKKKLLVVDRFPNTYTYKLLFYLKDYLEITYIMLDKSWKLEEFKNLGIKIYSFDGKGNKLKKLKEALKFAFRIIKERIKGYDFVLAKTAPNWIGYLLFKVFGKSKKIYLPYDIHFMVFKNNLNRSKSEFLFERYNFEHADFIIFKDSKEILTLLKKEEVSEIKGKSIYMHPPLSNSELSKEIGKYQYGLCSSSMLNLEKLDERFNKTGIASKIFSYFEAGLPIIVDEETEAMADLVRTHNCGIIILNRDWKNLKKIIRKQNYSELLKGVKRIREELNIEKQIKVLIKELGLKDYKN